MVVTNINAYIISQLQKSKCHYHDLNLTLLIENEEDDLAVEKEISPHLDSDVKTAIVLELKRNQIYSLQLRVEAYSYSTTTNKHYFRKRIFFCSSHHRDTYYTAKT